MRKSILSLAFLAIAVSLSGASHGGSSAADVAVVTEYDGLIKASRLVQLGAPIDGLLELVTVDRGDVVQRGQILALLESRLERATLALARARADMRAQERSRSKQLNYLTSKLARAIDLHDQGILADTELAVARTEQAVAEEALLESQELRSIALLELKRAEVALEVRTVKSPIDGVVVKRFLSPGELVTRQHQSKILELAQIDPLTVEVILPAEMFGKVRWGTGATIKPVGFPEHRSIAVVQSVDRVIDAASNSFRVALELPNRDHQLPAGLQCRVDFKLSVE